MIRKEQKAEVIAANRTHETDTGSPGSTDRNPDRAHQAAHRASEGAQARQPFPSWPAEDGWSAPQHARLPEEEGHRALQSYHR